MLRIFFACCAVAFLSRPQSTFATPPKEPPPGPQFPWVSAITFAKQGAILVWAEQARDDVAQRAIRWCDATTGKLIEPLDGFEGLVHAALATSTEGKYLAGTSFRDGVRVWDLEKEERLVLREKPLHSAALAFVPTDNRLLVQYAKEIVAYHVPSLKRAGTLEIAFSGRPFSAPHKSIAVSGDGKRAAAFFSGVRLWDIQTRKEIAQIDTPDEHNTIAISPDGNLVAYTTRSRGTLTIWDYKNKRQRFALNQRYHPMVAFSPTENILAGSNGELGLHFIDLKTGEVVRTFPEFKDGAYSVAFSADGKRIAASHASEIHIIDLATKNNDVVIKIPPLDEKKDQ